LEINQISGAIVDASMKVHSALGPGLLEGVYETCLKHELIKRGMRCHSQVPMPVIYDGVEIEMGFRLDLLVQDLVVVELKAIERLLPIHEAQLLTYLKLTKKDVGLLINFNVTHLRNGIKRIINNQSSPRRIDTGISDAVSASLDGSLQRLGLERVDIFHFHNPITVNGGGDSLSVRQMLDELVPAFESERQRGRTRFLGITAVGDTAALHEVIDARVFDSAQVSYNMLNPSAAAALPANYPAQDYGRLFEHTQAARVGVVGIRVLAGGALSGSGERHPIASPPPLPIGSAISYDADLARARRLRPLVEAGFAGSLSEAAIRFAISHPAIGTILVGMASLQQFEHALAAVLQGPLSPTAMDGLATQQQGFAGEAR